MREFGSRWVRYLPWWFEACLAFLPSSYHYTSFKTCLFPALLHTYSWFPSSQNVETSPNHRECKFTNKGCDKTLLHKRLAGIPLIRYHYKEKRAATINLLLADNIGMWLAQIKCVEAHTIWERVMSALIILLSNTSRCVHIWYICRTAR